MAPVELLTSESGEYAGGKWEPYKGAAGFADTPPTRLSALLRGQIVVKFEVQDDEALTSLSSGAKLHIPARARDICQVPGRLPRGWEALEIAPR
jgi:hypothetical protein